MSDGERPGDDGQEDPSGIDDQGERPGDDQEKRPGDDRKETGGGSRREPLADLTEEIEQRRRGRERGDPFEDAFEDVSVESVDADAVWEQLSREDAEPTVEPEPESEPDRGDRDVRVVEKRTFCQGCRYFSAPPTVACTHEGTEILELVDAGHFRVADCPMVTEAEKLTGELEGDDPSEV